MTQDLPSLISGELAEKAARFGYIGIFAHRETLQKAYDASMDIINSCDDKAAACTAMMICLNTTALIKARQVDVVDELRELARATQSYFEDHSRSGDRADALRASAVVVLKNAEEQFGPEGT